ncbi:MAG: hypothetical protein JSU77_07605 [Fidelibacterota bacterium]|nr:MAG: hypothetical protein JSU77_07605 [Candidatus Neomarinimicrobiota bacterium]
MTQSIDLKDLERKVFRSTFQDGLWDIFLGLMLFAMAVGALLSDLGMAHLSTMLIFSGIVALALAVIWAGKRFIIAPRMGLVQFGPEGTSRQKKTRWLLSLSLLFGTAIFIFTLVARNTRLEWLNPALFLGGIYTANMLIVFSLGAYFLNFTRLYLIGVMYAIPVPLDIIFHELADIDITAVAVGAPAVAVLLIGIVLFVRFLREYPLPVTEVYDAGE